MSQERHEEFNKLANRPHPEAQIYRLGDYFENLPREIAPIIVFDTSEIPGCHYGIADPFLERIRDLEMEGIRIDGKWVKISPETTILFEASTGNGWVTFINDAWALGYEAKVVMPDPEKSKIPLSRYKHPDNKNVEFVYSSGEHYVEDMPDAQMDLLEGNPDKLTKGEKIYVTPDHSVGGAERTIDGMLWLGRQALFHPLLRNNSNPLVIAISMGNGASFGLGEYFKLIGNSDVKVIATESLAAGMGYDKFARIKGLPSFESIFGISTGNRILMDQFKVYGTNAPIGVHLPLQERAMRQIIDEYCIFTDNDLVKAFLSLDETITPTQVFNALQLPNYSSLPQVLQDKFGNSALANIAVASRYTNQGKEVMAFAYDGRGNY